MKQVLHHFRDKPAAEGSLCECRCLEKGVHAGADNIISLEKNRGGNTYWLGDSDVAGLRRMGPEGRPCEANGEG